MPRLRWSRPAPIAGCRQASYWSTSALGLKPMADYRVYTVGLDGHFIGFEPLVCRDAASPSTVEATDSNAK